ncbi:MAG TPA: thiamine pyrophosphate-binding protein, partial [Armatimonadota bacterium]|nr:thiamine pyrophosphate-binding protein [Armatimonadota bacterium]
ARAPRFPWCRSWRLLVSAKTASGLIQTKRMINGAEAMALAFELAGVRIAYTYPITPQIEVMETLSRNHGITYIQADSEFNVLAGAQGALWAGERCAVATASQGLVLMSEVMWEVAGNRLPLVMGVFNRGLKGPGWCLGAQQNDTLFMRDTGWMQFYCESAQEVLDFILLAYRVGEEICLPAIVSGDGFYLSHETEEVDLPGQDEVTAFLGERMRCGDPITDKHANYGGLMPPPKYFSAYQRMHHDMLRAVDVFETAAAEFAERFGRRYELISPVYTEDAETVILSAGTTCGTIRAVVEQRRGRGEKIGLLKLHGMRPFPGEAIHRAVKNARRLIVIDRDVAPGLGGIFASEIRLALRSRGYTAPIYSFVTGLGGTDVTPEMVEQALAYVANSKQPLPDTLFLHETTIEA